VSAAQPRLFAPQALSRTARPIEIQRPVFAPGGDVTIRWTDYAPKGRYRLQQLFGPPIPRVLTVLLDRLILRPDEIEARDQALGDVVILTARRGQKVLPMAFIDGLDAKTINDGLASLARARSQ